MQRTFEQAFGLNDQRVGGAAMTGRRHPGPAWSRGVGAAADSWSGGIASSDAVDTWSSVLDGSGGVLEQGFQPSLSTLLQASKRARLEDMRSVVPQSRVAGVALSPSLNLATRRTTAVADQGLDPTSILPAHLWCEHHAMCCGTVCLTARITPGTSSRTRTSRPYSRAFYLLCWTRTAMWLWQRLRGVARRR